MKVFLTGGTGFLGKQVAAALDAGGHSLRLLARSVSNLDGLPRGAEIAGGDVTDAGFLLRAAEGCDAILHMAAVVKMWAPDPAVFDAVNVGGLRNALAAARATGVRLVYTSSFMAIGPAGPTPADESRTHPGGYRNDYERTKAQAEAVAREAAAAGQDVVMLYPGVVYGPGDLTDGNLVVQMAVDHLQGKLPGIIGPGDRLWSYAFVADVARGHLAALEQGRAGERYFLGGENVDMNGLFARLAELTGIPAPRRHIPYLVASALGRAMWAWAEVTGHPPQLTHEVVGVFREHWAYSSAKAERELGYRITPLREGLRKTVSWLRERELIPRGARVLTAGETKRKLVHIGVGGFALLLRFLDWRGAAALAVGAFLFNWQLLPRIGGKELWRGGEQAKGYPLGILLYPLSVLGLCLYFRHDLAKAAAVWGLLAVGDGMATVLGQALGGPRLPWNAGKGWVGLLSFLVFGTLAASFLMVWTLRLPPTALLAPRLLALTLPLALFCALVESLPTTLDDNLTVPLAGAVALTLLAQADFGALRADPALGGRLLLGLTVNGVVALGAKLAGSIDVPGALSAIVIGTVITGALGLRGFALIAAFFVVGSLVTKLGYRVKAARGIAQEKGGARGWRNAWANGGVPALLALMVAVAPSDLRLLYLLAYAASVGTAAADTCSSEIGKAYGRRTFLITSLRPVPAGTEGAVSLEGTLGGLLGAALVAGLGASLGLYSWLAAVLIAVAGLLGSLAESVLGTVAERKGWMDNDLLNALNTALGAVFVVFLLRLFPLSS